MVSSQECQYSDIMLHWWPRRQRQMRCESEQFQSLAEASSWFLLQAPFPLPLASSFPQAHTSDSLGRLQGVKRRRESRKCSRSPVTGQCRKEPKPGKFSLLSPQVLPPPYFCMESKWIWGRTSVLLWTGFICLSPLVYSIFALTLP